jgi:hypothetical protein
MSLEHTTTRSHRRAPRSQASEITSLPDDHEVLTIAEWRAINKIKPRTAARILAGPPDQRPVITQMSERRYGITRRNNRIWQASRAR